MTEDYMNSSRNEVAEPVISQAENTRSCHDTSENSGAGLSEKDAAIRAIGLAQRLLLWVILGSIIGNVVIFFLAFTVPVSVFPLTLIILGFQFYGVIKLAHALDMHVVKILICLLLMFIPIVSLITLFVLNQMATSELTYEGIRVGFMGANPKDLPGS